MDEGFGTQDHVKLRSTVVVQNAFQSTVMSISDEPNKI